MSNVDKRRIYLEIYQKLDALWTHVDLLVNDIGTPLEADAMKQTFENIRTLVKELEHPVVPKVKVTKF